MANVRIQQLPEDLAPADTDVVAVDAALGGTTRRVPLPNLADQINPVASEPEAVAGANNTKRMPPLRVKQSIVANAKTGSWTSSATDSVARTIDLKLDESYSLLDAGAVPNNPAVDNTAALNKFFTQAAARGAGKIPVGEYFFKSPLDPVVANNYCVDSDSARAILTYNGAATTGDLATFGSAGTPTSKLDLRGFMIRSTTDMSGGYGVRVVNVHEVEFNLLVGDGDFKLLNGAVFDKSSNINLHSSIFAAKSTGIDFREVIEGHCNNARVAGRLVGGFGSGAGVHIADCNGIYGENLRQLFNEYGCLIDTSASGAGNTQIFLRTAIFDSNKTAAVWVDDSVSGPIGKTLEVPWCSSTTVGSGLVVLNWRDGDINATNAQIRNNVGNGVTLQDATSRWLDTEGTVISDNGIYGIEATTPMTIRSSASGETNASGLYSSNLTVIQEVSGTRVHRAPAVGWLDDVTALSHTVANGANIAIPVGTGEVLITILETGDTMKVLVGGGGVGLCTDGGVSTAVGFGGATTAPAGGKWSVGFDGSRYRVYNNTGGSKTFVVAPQYMIRAGV